MKSILFIGNSFTFANDLDVRVLEMAASANIEIYTDRIAYGGYSLFQYVDFDSKEGKEVLCKLNEREWDIVVLQDHSQGPIRNYEKFKSASKILCDLIKQHGAKPIFYETWAYRPNSEKMASVGISYEDMHKNLANAYRTVAKENDTVSIPVGEAFYKMLALENGPDPLWTVDDYHPCFCGTFLAATIFCLYLIDGIYKTDYCPKGNEPLSLDDVAVCWRIAESVKNEFKISI